jgi:hypothetical protein
MDALLIMVHLVVVIGKEAIDICTRFRVAVDVSGSLNFVVLRLFRRIGLNACPFYYSSPVYTELLIGFSYTKFSEDEVKKFEQFRTKAGGI